MLSCVQTIKVLFTFIILFFTCRHSMYFILHALYIGYFFVRLRGLRTIQLIQKQDEDLGEKMEPNPMTWVRMERLKPQGP